MDAPKPTEAPSQSWESWKGIDKMEPVSKVIIDLAKRDETVFVPGRVSPSVEAVDERFMQEARASGVDNQGV